MSRLLPRTQSEVINQIELVSGQRTRTGSPNFTLTELKEIAKNLRLDSSGTKDLLADRILTDVRAYGAPTRQLPQTYPQLLNELHRIGGQRTVRGSTNFTLTELKEIARNLGLAQNGSKQDIANRLLGLI